MGSSAMFDGHHSWTFQDLLVKKLTLHGFSLIFHDFSLSVKSAKKCHTRRILSHLVTFDGSPGCCASDAANAAPEEPYSQHLSAVNSQCSGLIRCLASVTRVTCVTCVTSKALLQPIQAWKKAWRRHCCRFQLQHKLCTDTAPDALNGCGRKRIIDLHPDRSFWPGSLSH